MRRPPLVQDWRQRPQEARGQAERLRSDVVSALGARRIHELLPFAGQSAGLVHGVLPAGEIVRTMLVDAQAALRKAARRTG